MHYQETRVKQLGETFSIVCTNLPDVLPALQHIYTESGLLRGVCTYTPFLRFWGGLIDPNIKNEKEKGKKGITLQKKKNLSVNATVGLDCEYSTV